MQTVEFGNPIDVHVGAQVRDRRKALGMSQEALAAGLGLTFQQVQKYERGANRISSSKLFEIGRILAVPVQYFFAGLPTHEPPADAQSHNAAVALHAFLMTDEGRQLAMLFPKIAQPNMRRRVVELVRAMAEADETEVA